MSHLLAMAVGPVQEFIAAARRTRDLWFGSQLLSDISRAVAESIRGKLIFPASIDAPNVANVVLAEVEDPENEAKAAQTAAHAKWRQIADRVLDNHTCIRPDIWKDQVDDVIEFVAAWTALDDYPAARARVMRLLAGRKNCRDFLAANGRAGVPKSSLDGLRESVLMPAGEWSERDRRELRVREGEQLDVIGLVKRVAVDRPYPSVSRVAADPWLRGRAAKLGPVKTECERLGKQIIRRLDLDHHPHYSDFPYEGTAVFLNRHHELEEEADCKGLLKNLAREVAKLGEPNAYLAVIVADGDKMGEALGKLQSVNEHRAFSSQLATFAEKAREIVHRYRGVLVYSGGDDVLAFCPVDQCLDCARNLHDVFAELLAEWSKRSGTAITLSVGIAIAHFLENLEDLRQYGKKAEEHAKGNDEPKPVQKNGIAVHLHKRGGSPVKVRTQWTARPALENWADAPDTRIMALAVMLARGQLPTRFAGDLHQMAALYSRWQGDVAPALRRDIVRVAAAKRSRANTSVAEDLKPLLDRIQGVATLQQLADELLIAQQIARASMQANGHAAQQGGSE